MDFFSKLLDTNFMPHGHCYMWLPEILWLHVISDAAIALAYGSIPITLAVFVHKKKNMEFRGIFLLFSAFILCCGATHALEIYAVWEGAYRLTGTVKAVTAFVSVSTAFVLIRVLPDALALPTPSELRAANVRLAQETEDRLKAEAQLAKLEREKLFRNIVTSLSNGIVLVDPSGEVIMANQAAERIFGYDPETMVGGNLQNLVPEPFTNHHQQQVEAFFRDPNPKQMANGRELFGKRRDGSRVPLMIALTPLSWDGQELVLASIDDITERNRQRDALRRVHQRFDRAVLGASDGLWEWQVAEDKAWFSPQVNHLFGFPEEYQPESSLSFWLSRIHPDDKDSMNAELRRAKEEGTDFEKEHRIKTQDGRYRWFLAKAKNFFKGKAPVLSGSLTSIHQRKCAEAELETSKRFLDSIYDNVQQAIFVVDVAEKARYIFVAYNRMAEKASGIPSTQIIGKTILDMAPTYIPIEAAQGIQINYRTCFERKHAHQYTEMLPFQGKETWWLTNLTPQFDDSGEVVRIIGSASEITQLKKLENSLRDQEEYARKIIDYSLNGLYIFDLSASRNTFVNPSYTKLTGYSLEDLAHLDPDMMSLFHPDERELVSNHINRVLSAKMGESRHLEYRFRHKKGHWIWCYSSDTVFSVNKDGVPLEMIGTFLDITDMKKASERLKESNQELERFAFIASHDLREPLRKVSSFGNLLKKRFRAELPEKAQDYIDRMIGATSRMDHLVNDLLSLSRATTSAQRMERHDLNDILELVLNDLNHKIRLKNGRIEVDPLPSLHCDHSQMYQLFLNLIGNAVKYAREEVAPHIIVAAKQRDNLSWEISVQDNGVGFEEEYQEDIFGAFRRLHSRDEFEGSGIGLAICKKIVERHDGRIWAKGAPGSGATFTVNLPGA